MPKIESRYPCIRFPLLLKQSESHFFFELSSLSLGNDGEELISTSRKDEWNRRHMLNSSKVADWSEKAFEMDSK